MNETEKKNYIKKTDAVNFKVRQELNFNIVSKYIFLWWMNDNLEAVSFLQKGKLNVENFFLIV